MKEWFRGFLSVLYIFVVGAIFYASIALIDEQAWETIKTALSRQMLKFCLAAFAIVMGEVFYAWRYQINARDGFNAVEGNGMAFAVFAGLHFLGFSILAASIFGAV